MAGLILQAIHEEVASWAKFRRALRKEERKRVEQPEDRYHQR